MRAGYKHRSNDNIGNTEERSVRLVAVIMMNTYNLGTVLETR